MATSDVATHMDPDCTLEDERGVKVVVALQGQHLAASEGLSNYGPV